LHQDEVRSEHHPDAGLAKLKFLPLHVKVFFRAAEAEREFYFIRDLI
jgi:hypothetical protein